MVIKGKPAEHSHLANTAVSSSYFCFTIALTTDPITLLIQGTNLTACTSCGGKGTNMNTTELILHMPFRRLPFRHFTSISTGLSKNKNKNKQTKRNRQLNLTLEVTAFESL